MNRQDNTESNNQQSAIEDLTVNEDQAAEVKGGPRDHDKWINVESVNMGGHR